MKKYLKITIIFALTVVIVATMCILPTFAQSTETLTLDGFDDILVGDVLVDTEIVFLRSGGSTSPAHTNVTFTVVDGEVRLMTLNEEDVVNVITWTVINLEKNYDELTNRTTIYANTNTSEYELVRYNIIDGTYGFPLHDGGIYSYTFYGIQFNDVTVTQELLDVLGGFVKDNVSDITVERTLPPTPTDSITGIFTNISGWIVTAIGNTVPMFYNAQAAELTILGVLAVVGLAIAVIFLLINVIKRFIQFRS